MLAKLDPGVADGEVMGRDPEGDLTLGLGAGSVAPVAPVAPVAVGH